jgi:hypothetical protein
MQSRFQEPGVQGKLYLMLEGGSNKRARLPTSSDRGTPERYSSDLRTGRTEECRRYVERSNRYFDKRMCNNDL